MGDDQRRPACRKLVKIVLDFCLRHGVQRGGGLVQNQNGRVFQEDTGDGDPLPPFRGEPKCIRIELPIREFTNLLWNSLNEQNKVSLFVRYVDLETGEVEQEIRNKNAE